MIEFSGKVVSDSLAAKIKEKIIACMSETIKTEDGVVMGCVFSDALEATRTVSKGVGYDGESLFEALGFKIERNAKNYRGQKVRAVVL